MDLENLQTFIRSAGNDLASIRSSLLVMAQNGDASGLAVSRHCLARLRAGAGQHGQSTIADLVSECDSSFEGMTGNETPPPDSIFRALDIVARIEATLWDLSDNTDDFPTDVAGFVDASFDKLAPTAAGPPDEQFEIDDETLDIFRSEAEELLANIALNLPLLRDRPADQDVLWEIRRNAHTFKGAAGIVGMREASQIAHRMEDLLDKMVEMRRDAVPQLVDFLEGSSKNLNDMVAARNTAANAGELNRLYSNVQAWLSSDAQPTTDRARRTATTDASDAGTAPSATPVTSTPTPIVRVSLDRLDELLKISRSLVINQSALAERFAEIAATANLDAEARTRVESLFDTGHRLTDEMHLKLLRIRMVKFGMLETRLNRAVHSTCLDENKRATVELENGDLEVDTQVIDALVEPLLHLLKNAVVHGIEPPETRRLIGKPETGTIRIRIEADDEALVLSVADDGGGISIEKLKGKAVNTGILSKETAASISDAEAMKLIFDRGLTTADRIDLNAGRGVGMSIVKESIESRGGTVVVDSEYRRGTTFTILMPLAIAKIKSKRPAAPPVEPVNEPDSSQAALVLIVDDSASIRRHNTKLVQAAGYRTVTADNGAEALELLLSSDWEPDLILSDIEMPHVDGWEFLEYIKTDANFGHIPVIMITSLDTPEHRQRAFDLGASEYFIKPFGSGEMEKISERLSTGIAV